MRKKVRRSLALLLALTMMVTLVKSEELFVSAESSSISAQASSDTEETVQAEADVSLPEAEAVSEGEQAEETAEETLPEETPSEEVPSEVTQMPADETEVPKEEVSAEVPETPAEETTVEEGTAPAEVGTTPDEESPAEEKQPEGETPTETETSEKDKTPAETEVNEGELPTDETKVPEAEEEKPLEEIEEQPEDTETEEAELMEYIPEEQPDGISVKAYAEKGVLPENVHMSVTALTEEGDTSAQYSEAADALENSKVEYDGFVAYDISFLDEDGNKIEPEDGSVQVKFELDAGVLPEDADTETLAVQHLAETEDGVEVQTVADVKDETEGTVEVKTEDAVVAAEFEVESFSTFTITWSGNWETYFNLTVHYVEGNANGSELQTSTSNISLKRDQSIALKDYASAISGYSYNRAEWNGKSITKITSEEEGILFKTRNLYFYDGEDPVGNLTYNNQTITGDIYLIYDKDEPLSTIQGVDTAGRVDISVYDYNTSTVGINGFPFTGAGWTGKGNGVTQGVVNSTLSNGYPVLKNGNTSLSYLFDENSSSRGRVKTISSANYLFQRDAEGYYYYDSKENFAEVKDDGMFTLYSAPRANGTVPASEPLFLPFNTLSGSKTTQDGYTSYKLNEATNYSFGMEIGTTFLQPKDGKINGKDMVFEFDGDDDVWVFIDDVLVLDLGGVHDSCSGSINFATGAVYVNKVYDATNKTNAAQNTTISQMFEAAGKTWDGSDYSSHTLKFFYLERGQGGSNCKIKFNLQTIPKGTISFQKDLIYANVADAADFEFSFKTYVDYDGMDDNYELYTGSYSIYNVGDPNTPISTGTAGSDGIIKLKDGQFAQLNSDKILATSKFYVQELGVTSDKYNVTVSGTTMETIYEDNTSVASGVQTSKLEVGKKPYIVFENSVSADNQFNLEVKKEMKTGQNSSDTFQLKVLLGNAKVPYTGRYTLHKADGTTASENASNGIISLQAGEYATIAGLVGGNKVRVEEVNLGTLYEAPEYGMTSASDSIVGDSVKPDASGITGTAKEGKALGREPVMTVQVTNSLKTGSMKIQKTVNGISDDSKALIPDGTFKFEIKNASGTKVKEVSLPATVDGNKVWEITAEDLMPGTYTVVETANSELTVGGDTYSLVKVNNRSIAEAGCKETQVDVVADSAGTNPVCAEYTNEYKKQCGLTVSKTVAGNMGDRNKAFEFQIAVKDGTAPVGVDGTYGTGVNAVTITNGKFSLKNGQSVTIPNLLEGYTYTVTETDYSGEGYSTPQITKTVGSNDSTSITNREDSDSLTADTTLEFTNTKNIKAPTGLHHNWTPYILMLAMSMCMAISLIIMGCMKMRRSRRQRRDI